MGFWNRTKKMLCTFSSRLCFLIGLWTLVRVSARLPNDDEQQQQQLVVLPMETMEIAPGVDMPVVSIGTGGMESRSAYEVVSNWLQLGGRGIDTALNYRNQPKIRTAIRDYNSTDRSFLSRSDLFLTTKIPDCNASNTAEYVRQDLEQLQTPYLDLVLLHSPRNGDCAKAWSVLEQFFLDHTIRAIGVSNFKRTDLEPLLEHALVIPAVNQIKLNLAHKDQATIEYSSQQGIVIQAYSPLGRGSGEVVDLAVVRAIAKERNVTPYQIALRWILQHGWILTFQSSSKEHQEIDANVFGWELTTDEMERLDGIGTMTLEQHVVKKKNNRKSDTGNR